MKIAGAVELFWLAAMDMGVRVWHFIATSKKVSTAAAQGHQFPVMGIG